MSRHILLVMRTLQFPAELDKSKAFGEWLRPGIDDYFTSLQAASKADCSSGFLSVKREASESTE